MRWRFVAMLLVLSSCSSFDDGLTVQLDAAPDGGPEALDGWLVTARPLVSQLRAMGEVDGSLVSGASCEQLRQAEPSVVNCEEVLVATVAWDRELTNAETNGVGLAYLDVDTSQGVYIDLATRPTEADPLCVWLGGEQVDPGARRVVIPILEACE